MLGLPFNQQLSNFTCCWIFAWEFSLAKSSLYRFFQKTSFIIVRNVIFDRERAEQISPGYRATNDFPADYGSCLSMHPLNQKLFSITPVALDLISLMLPSFCPSCVCLELVKDRPVTNSMLKKFFLQFSSEETAFFTCTSCCWFLKYFLKSWTKIILCLS